ncbi:FeoC-like transcriptional regulator [Austwickia chelonae]|uniref:FeoC-like transcriptional regulator n=1 Tax=Austwickia chelonae TaxID=100225 RepID=UPI0013C34E8F|nr:FeoC-like transcriptional regulator [Austwickia chelonae]
MSGPLRQVLDAVEGGAVTVGEIASRTGIDRDVVAASVAHLARVGRVDSRMLSSGCSDAGCGGCSTAGPDDSPGCGGAGERAQRAPVLLRLFSRGPAARCSKDGGEH